MPEVVNRAPGFVLYDSEKKQRKMLEFLKKGHRTIFAFFPGAFTGVCTQEMCSMVLH